MKLFDRVTQLFTAAVALCAPTPPSREDHLYICARKAAQATFAFRTIENQKRTIEAEFMPEDNPHGLTADEILEYMNNNIVELTGYNSTDALRKEIGEMWYEKHPELSDKERKGIVSSIMGRYTVRDISLPQKQEPQTFYN